MATGGASAGVDSNAAAAAVQFQSRDELRKLRDLEEARKSGLIPAEKDEEGRDINPHIPQYIAKAPWYLNQEGPSLKHQRQKAPEGHTDLHKWYRRGVYGEYKPNKFRPGACTNCGAMTHAAKECTERPRKIGARWNQKDMQRDEIIDDGVALDLNWEEKRDRWGGYDSSSYSAVIREYEMAEVERKRRKQNELENMLKSSKSRKKRRKLRARINQLKEVGGNEALSAEDEGEEDSGTDHADSDSDSDSDCNDSDDEDEARIKDFDKHNAVVGTKDSRTRTTTRNLRIREDTAKYLHNLDVNSAFYDPKTRSMRDDPFKGLKADRIVTFRGDNRERSLGEASGVAKMEIFAWETYKHGGNVHFQAMPTQLESVAKQHEEKKQTLVQEKKDSLLSHYGGREHLNPPPGLLQSQTEAYVEYSRDGTVKKGRERVFAMSKYEEDVFPGLHTSVWGSYYDMERHLWGFACCKEVSQGAVCTAVREEKFIAA